jgi:mRNA-degrading endonuclease RelE of RelBE toxin-antitoxin system
MRIQRTDRFLKDFGGLPGGVQKQALRKLALLGDNLAHPSLRIKRVRSRTGVYEGSINMDYRFLFLIEGDTCTLLRVGRHDILDQA